MKKLLYKILRWSARLYIKRTNPYIIGITGSVGKTSCRMVVAQTMQQLMPDTRISTSPKNFNSEVGLCLSILEITKRSTHPVRVIWSCLVAVSRGIFSKKRYDVLVAEYGIDGLGDMDYLVSIARPDSGIFTVLDTVHALQLGTPDETLAEKAKLFNAVRDVLFISVPALSYTQKYTQGLEVDQLSYAIQDNQYEQADIWWRNRILETDEQGVLYTQFTVEQGNDSVQTVRTNLLTQIDAGYVSLGIECAMIVGLRLGQVVLEHTQIDTLSYHLQPGRMSVFPGQWGSVLVDSSYNGAPKSMRSMIDTMVMLRNELYQGFDLIYCLGDMRELGDFSEKEHRALAGVIAQSADALYLVGKETGDYMLDELKKIGYNTDDVHWSMSSSEIGSLLLQNLPKREKRALVLFKGSQNTIFLEEAIKPLLQHPQDSKKLPRQSSFWLKKKVLSMLLVSSCLCLVGCGGNGDLGQPVDQLPSQPQQNMQEQLLDVPVATGSTACIADSCFEVEIADEGFERQRGLMWREQLADDKGMLFVFEQPGPYNFWMKNTLIPLDMLWLDQYGSIIYIQEKVQPCASEVDVCPSYGPKSKDTLYVLELAGGVVDKKNIELGDVLRVE